MAIIKYLDIILVFHLFACAGGLMLPTKPIWGIVVGWAPWRHVDNINCNFVKVTAFKVQLLSHSQALLVVRKPQLPSQPEIFEKWVVCGRNIYTTGKTFYFFCQNVYKK